MLMLSLIKGTSRDFPLQANNPDGTPAGGVFLGSDAIASRVWRGDAQPTLVAPATAWLSAPLGTFQVAFGDADTQALECGQYRIQTTAARAGRTAVLLDAWLRLSAAPGAAASRPTYGPSSDLVKYAKWIANLQDPDDLEGFADQRADAREWLDHIILLNDRGSSLGGFGAHSRAASAWGGAGPRRALVPSPWLRAALAADQLIVRPQVLRIVAFRAIAEVCLGQLGKGGDYASYGAMFRQAADSECCGLRAEIDTNNDGRPELAIPITTASTLYT
ncbi:MAG TPA: hypothetical protein VKP69_34610 [Isosphaeraceae bacterium]|nr:hypothetical protein [Isosphaeraceae bacterium]